MSAAEAKQARKQAYFAKLVKLFDEYPKVFLVFADNVGSNHMQKIRISLRGKAVILMGKNTMIRKAIRGHVQNNPNLEALLPHVKGNIGFVFTKGDLNDVRKKIIENRVPAVAKPGAISPLTVIIPKGNTGLEPTQTAMLQALNIQSKINKGQIEIVNDVTLLTEGQKVGASEAALLAKLDIKPFSYGLAIKTVYDNGAIYDAKVLDLTDDDILAKFSAGVKNIAAIGLKIGYPTIASVPHSVARGYKNVASLALGTTYTFPKVEKLRQYLANPAAFAAAAAPAAAKGGDKKGDAKKDAAPVKKEAPPPAAAAAEEEDGDVGFGLFGDD